MSLKYLRIEIGIALERPPYKERVLAFPQHKSKRLHPLKSILYRETLKSKYFELWTESMHRVVTLRVKRINKVRSNHHLFVNHSMCFCDNQILLIDLVWPCNRFTIGVNCIIDKITVYIISTFSEWAFNYVILFQVLLFSPR